MSALLLCGVHALCKARRVVMGPKLSRNRQTGRKQADEMNQADEVNRQTRAGDRITVQVYGRAALAPQLTLGGPQSTEQA